MYSQLVLNIYERSNPLRQVRLTEAEYTVGREYDCQICLQDSEVSRHHLNLRLERSGENPLVVPNVFLEDLNSTNGTIVNGQRVQQYQLQVGDRIQIGGTLMALDLQKVYKEKKPDHSETLEPSESSAAISENTAETSASLLGPRAEAGFFDPGFAPIQDSDPDSVDVTVGSAEDQDRILRTISHTEGEKLLSPERTEKLKAEGSWATRAQGFLHLLYEMTLSLSRCTDIDRLTAELLDLIFQWVDADRGCILLFDSSSNRLIPRAKKVREEFKDERFIISTSMPLPANTSASHLAPGSERNLLS